MIRAAARLLVSWAVAIHILDALSIWPLLLSHCQIGYTVSKNGTAPFHTGLLVPGLTPKRDRPMALM